MYSSLVLFVSLALHCYCLLLLLLLVLEFVVARGLGVSFVVCSGRSCVLLSLGCLLLRLLFAVAC